ncbi:hypothetical protein DL96DRAFT_1690813 [Flagelloscypha sp. PMI_526]|nr:hypothetical protein DL96DRAFT_1690813 [Flagelloscypha sp. PMI_526]
MLKRTFQIRTSTATLSRGIRVQNWGPGLVACLYAIPVLYLVYFIVYEVATHGNWFAGLLLGIVFVMHAALRGLVAYRSAGRQILQEFSMDISVTNSQTFEGTQVLFGTGLDNRTPMNNIALHLLWRNQDYAGQVGTLDVDMDSSTSMPSVFESLPKEILWEVFDQFYALHPHPSKLLRHYDSVTFLDTGAF